VTWVPPAHRQAGEPRPPEGASRRPTRSRWWLIATGTVATAVALVVAYFATFLAAFVNSVCGDTPSVVAAHRNSLRVWLIVIWLIAAGVPGLFAGLAKAQRRPMLPWAIVAVVIGGFGLTIGLTVRPSTWCMY